MLYVSKRTSAPRSLTLVLAAVLALTIVGVASAEFPTKRSDPGIVGVAQEGQTLQGRTGQWLLDNGLKCEDCKYRYTWQRCAPDGSGCADIPGATAFPYVLTAADVGKRMRFVEWIFKRDCGAHNSQTGAVECNDVEKNAVSPLTLPVAPKPVTIAQASNVPTIQGTAMEDEILQATGATWTGPGTITKVFFWQRCNISGEGCATIIAANASSYRLGPADVGSRLRVIETATNEGGTAQAVSAVTNVVAELRPSASRPTIAVTRVDLPHRLVLDQVVPRQTGRTVTLRVKVSDSRGFRVTGVQVRVTPTGLLAGSARLRVSDRTGWATFRYRATGSGLTHVYVDARRAGEKPQSGISTANLFRIRVR